MRNPNSWFLVSALHIHIHLSSARPCFYSVLRQGFWGDEKCSVPTKQDQEQKIRSRSKQDQKQKLLQDYRAPDKTFIGSFCLKRSSCSIRIFCFIEAPIKIICDNRSTCVKRSTCNIRSISNTRSLCNNRSAEVSCRSAEVSCFCFCVDQVQKLLLRSCFFGTLEKWLVGRSKH